MPGIFLLHAVEHHRGFGCHLVAELNVLLLGGKVRKHTTHGSRVGRTELRQFLNNLGCAHTQYATPAVPVGHVPLLVNAYGVSAPPGSLPLPPQAARRWRDGFPPHLDRETSAGRPRLLNPALALYISTMIAVKAENGCLQVTIPTEGMTPSEVNEFVSWLRVESVVRRSRLTPETAWKLSEDIKSEWWQANERRFTPEGGE